MNEKKYSKQHEWVTIEGDVATIGITTYAAEMLGDVVFVELPEKGKNVEKEGQVGVVESTKAASDVYTPITGEIIKGDVKKVEKGDDDPKMSFGIEMVELYAESYDEKRFVIPLDYEFVD